MSCLTQEERLGLEDIFLSIGVTPSPFDKCKNLYARCAPLLGKANLLTRYTPSRKQLRSYAQAKLFLRIKKENFGRHLCFSRHK